MADALDSGSSGATRWGFDSPLPHHTQFRALRSHRIITFGSRPDSRPKEVNQFFLSSFLLAKENVLHLNLLLENIDEFNNLLKKIADYTGVRKLIDYLVWYNTERPHKSLNNLTPIDFLLTPLYSRSLSAN